jgi:Concanavalin A-like lectin/glucanases superfamily
MRTSLRFVPGLCLLGCLALPAEAQVIADWQFEEGSGVVFLNSAARGRERNHGVLINQLGYVSFQFEDSERFSLLFDGINDIGVVPDSTSLRPRRAISLEAWINPSPSARVVVGKQVGLFADATVNSYQLELNPFCFNLTDESGVLTQACGPEPSPDVWHHVVGTWNGGTMELYLDGVLVASAPFAGPIAYDNNPVLIGGDDDGAGIPGCCLFSGAIDRVRISHRPPFDDDDDDDD